jgi:hypothetical protein
MKHVILSISLGVSLAFACAAFAAVPTLNVTVADSSGKAAYKGATNAKGTFATGTLKPGGYTVQFNSSSAPSGKFAVVISAGSKKVTANAIGGEKFAIGGVAMKNQCRFGPEHHRTDRCGGQGQRADGS